MDARQVTDIFVERAFLTPEQAEEFVKLTATEGKPIERLLVDHQVVDEDGFIQVIAESLGVESYNLQEFAPDTTVLGLIPSGLARLHGAMPIMGSGNTIIIALTDPLNSQTVEELRFALGRDIQVMVAFPSRVAELIRQHYGSEITNFDDIIAQLGAGSDLVVTEGGGDNFNLQSVTAEANTGPIIKYVDAILDKAISARASDIHFEPFESEFKIRYRVDGALYEMDPPPLHLALPVISRVKVMSNLNIAERRLPQDGRIQRTMANGRQVDLRVSTLPTTFGESVVLRVLDRSSVNLDLESLGVPEDIYNYILQVIERPNGIFIVTGPTGSGKTTTLYSCLRKINTIDSKLLTAEDPVEYEIDGIIQVPINEGIGLTFARTLRAFLRQDPDRILVGETRDVETAQIAIQASLTGHLVFTTLHTNDSTGAVTRLVDMGVEPFLISASLECILAQRLIRKICTSCRTTYEPNEHVLATIGLGIHDIGDKNFYYGKGCEECNHTGYKGRKGIYELLKISDPIREMINERAPGVLLRQKAIELGMTTLREDGLRSIFDGLTTIEEVIKYT